MFRLLFVVLLIIGCSVEEETSEFASSDSSDNREIVRIERADVNRDGIVNILDLTAVSHWIGEKVADWLGSDKKVLVERDVSSELLKNSEIEVGKFFWIFVSATMDLGTRFAHDFYTDGRRDLTCKITTEIVALDGAGEMVPDAIAGFNAYPSHGDDPAPAPSLGKPAYVPSERMNGHGYNTRLLMFFTDSALRNNVKKLIVKSGSKCGGYSWRKGKHMRKKLTPLAEVAQIPVTIRDRSDDLTVVANLLGEWGSLHLEFSRDWGADNTYAQENSGEEMKDRTETKHLVVMLVDNSGIQRGYFSSERGVVVNWRKSSYPTISKQVYGGSDKYGYTIQYFGYISSGWNWNSQKQFTCGEGWRVLVLVQDLHKVTRMGTIWVAKEGTTTIYDGPCS